MLNNLFQLPNTFDSDDNRRKHILNLILIAFIGLALAIIIVTFVFLNCQCAPNNRITPALIIGIATLIINNILLVANRSPRIPGWLSATIFVAFLIIAIAQVDSPNELYNGSGLIAWVVPIMVAAIVLRPMAVFAIAGIVSATILIFSPPNIPPNYYAIIVLFAIAFLCWLVMSLANRSIQDARRQSASIEAILNTITEGVLVLDSLGNFVSANRALLRMIPEDKLKELNDKPLEETIQWKRTVFSVTASVIPDMGSVLVFQNETRRLETERAKDALLATASHELRTPLGAVMNYLELLLMLLEMGKFNTEKFKEHLSRALENSRRLLDLINDILDQAQLQAGMLEMKREPFNLPALLEKNRKLLDIPLKEKDLSYELTVDPGVPEEITGDPERLHQVLVNLVGNAIKFTSQGGIQVKVSLPYKDVLSIEVSDTGPGIPEEQLPDIFEAFRRASNYAEREHQGAGLGLSIAKELVTRMGGDISAASTLGVGTTFTVSLPVGGSPVNE